jgi:hypothetical protein
MLGMVSLLASTLYSLSLHARSVTAKKIMLPFAIESMTFDDEENFLYLLSVDDRLYRQKLDQVCEIDNPESELLGRCHSLVFQTVPIEGVPCIQDFLVSNFLRQSFILSCAGELFVTGHSYHLPEIGGPPFVSPQLSPWLSAVPSLRFSVQTQRFKSSSLSTDSLGERSISSGWELFIWADWSLPEISGE